MGEQATKELDRIEVGAGHRPPVPGAQLPDREVLRGQQRMGHVEVSIVGRIGQQPLGPGLLVDPRAGEGSVEGEHREVDVQSLGEAHLVLDGAAAVSGGAQDKETLTDDVVGPEQLHRLLHLLHPQSLVERPQLLISGSLDADLHHAIAHPSHQGQQLPIAHQVVRPTLVEPVEAQVPLQNPLADGLHVVAADVETIVGKPDTGTAIFPHQQLQLLDNGFRVAGPPTRSPEGPFGAEGAAIGTPPAGLHHTKGMADELEVVALHGQEVVGGDGECLGVHGRRRGRLDDLPMVPVGDPRHGGPIGPRFQGSGQSHQRPLPLPPHDHIHLRMAPQRLLGGEGYVRATQHGDDVGVHLLGDASGVDGLGEVGSEDGGAHQCRLGAADDLRCPPPAQLQRVAVHQFHRDALFLQHSR